MGSVGDTNGVLSIDADIIIIGGGFSGLYALNQARELGLTVKLIEAGSDYGGTWHWVGSVALPTLLCTDIAQNRYPGARVDT